MTNPLLTIAALAVVGVFSAQNYLVPLLRQKSISAGLTGPYHWFLDGAMALLSVALWSAFRHETPVQQFLADGAAVSLALTAASGTYTTQLGQNGEKIHSALTAATFVLALLLQGASNHTAGMWGMTGLGIAAALATHFLVTNASVTEKVGVIGLCSWLVAFSL